MNSSLDVMSSGTDGSLRQTFERALVCLEAGTSFYFSCFELFFNSSITSLRGSFRDDCDFGFSTSCLGILSLRIGFKIGFIARMACFCVV